MKRAFTLIELLVVIAIIAILAALLMPALERARTMAKQAKCSANLHNIGIGVSMFRGDHGQRWIAGPQNWWTMYQPCELQAFVMKDYVQDWNVWLCPTFQGQGSRKPGIALLNQWWPTINQGNSQQGSYLSQCLNCWENPPLMQDQGVNSVNWAACEDICYFYDEADIADNPDPSRVIEADGIAMYDWRGAEPANHREGSNALFVDNAVQWIPISNPTIRWTQVTDPGAQNSVDFGGAHGETVPTNAGTWVRYGYVQNPRLRESNSVDASGNGNPGYNSIYDREGTPGQWWPGNPDAFNNWYQQGAQARNAGNWGLPMPSKIDCAVGGGQVEPPFNYLGGAPGPMYRGPYCAPAPNIDQSLVGWQWGVVEKDEAGAYQ